VAGLLGARAVFAFPLTIGVIRPGVMRLYRSSPGPLARAQLGDRLLFSDTATVLLLDGVGHGDEGMLNGQALLYSGVAGLLAGTIPFIRRAAEASDTVLAIVPGPQADVLRRKLRAAAAQARFAEAALSGNPAAGGVASVRRC
jgi:hypothetical protein